MILQMRLLELPVVFTLGLAVGWFFHEVATDLSPVAGLQTEDRRSMSPMAALSSTGASQNLDKAIAPISDDIATLLGESGHAEILRRLRAVRDSGAEGFSHLLDQLVLYLRKVAKEGRLEREQDLLLGIREMLPQEPRLLYLSAELALAREDYSAAIALLYELRDSRQEVFSDEQINNQLDLLIDAYRFRLQRPKQSDKLLQLFQQVTAKDQTRPEFFYELAKLHFEMRNLEEARSTLSYILSELGWGNRAQELLGKIDRFEALQTQYSSKIPLSRSGRHFLLTCLIDGMYEAVLLLDTGASFTTLSPTLLAEMGIDQTGTPSVVLETSGGRITAQLYNASTIAVGDQMIANMAIAGVSLGQNTKADGLLGMNFLSNFEFFIDQEEAVLYLRPRAN